MFARVSQEKRESIFTRFLAQIREQGDVAAHDRLQGGAEVSDDAARANHNSTNDSKVSHNPVARQFHTRGNHSCVHSWHCTLLVRMEQRTKQPLKQIR